ncbi:hypothetical protein [Novosphingobium sp.]|jgi:hypothetical protein|uniref:hypothetical protein n=1 Tax=Novosphingobium sp. TaxID=1874826 RepID=UPI0028A5CC15|nr:hypothetical protein [Novosphingobium sp.]
MSQAGLIVGILSVIGALVLATSHSRFRSMPRATTIKLALIWAAIIIGLVLIIQISGFQIRQ